MALSHRAENGSIPLVTTNFMKKFLKSLLFATLLLAGCMSPRGFPPSGEILNYDNVDRYVARGAQPNAVGLHFLAMQHITLDINLRDVGDTWVSEGQTATNNGMKYLWVPLKGFGSPSKADIDKIMAAIETEKAAGGKVFIHCQHGADRTGTVIACYKIKNYRMLYSDAQKEADFFGLSKLEFGMRHFIKNYKP